MKYFKIAVILIPLMMVSCLEVETTTRVNNDGSIDRSILLKGSEKSISETSFNIPRYDLDRWEITRDSLGEDRSSLAASATFNSVEDLNQSWKLNFVEPGVQTQANLFIDEGFFFSRYIYRETIWADLPGPALPMEPFLSKSQLDSLIINDTDEGEGLLDSVASTRLEEQLDNYMQQVIFQDFINLLREGGQRSGNLEVIDEMLEEHSDALLKSLNATNFYSENLVWKSILGDYIDSVVVNEIEQANSEGLLRFYKSWQFFEEVLLDDYSFSLELPGVIRSTSASDVRGNRMTWEPETIVLFFGGVSLEAESSVIKPWSLIITGMLLLLTLVVTLAGFIRQGNRKQAV